MMFSLYKQTLTSSIQRVHAATSIRCCSQMVIQEPLDVPTFVNEPILAYRKGSTERNDLERELKRMCKEVADVPLVIGGEEVRVGESEHIQTMPHAHKHALARYRWATRDQISQAAEASIHAQKRWDRETSLSKRIQIWLRAADLVSGKYRASLNAATMLGQGKTAIQAEIDAACELADFFRAAAHHLAQSTHYKPLSPHPTSTINSMRNRGMEGFVAAVSPFNFTAIGGNLAYTPALAGCSVLWKPSDTAILSNWLIWCALTEAGVPRDVVNFIPCNGPTFGDTITSHPNLAAINFTGSVPTFQRLWKQVGANVERYLNFPKVIGECGGKNFHLIHKSADVKSVVAATLRSAFEYQGQKCSACSRMYVPRSLWPQIEKGLIEGRKKLKMGDPTDFSMFMTAVIDATAFKRISSYIKHAQDNLKVIGGGKVDGSVGYYVEPTIVLTENPRDRIMTEEIFGPVLTIYVYEDKLAESDELFNLVDESTPYALTGAVFAQDANWLDRADKKLRWATGNYYVNDKCTGSVVGQQPFGGSRMSGTNDKAGGPHYVLRWTTPQAVKQTFVPVHDVTYPYMQD